MNTRLPTPTRCAQRAARPRPHGTASAAAGAARDARPPRRSSSSCDLPAPSAARAPSGRSTAGSPAGGSTRLPVPSGPPAARTGPHRLPWQQRLPRLDRVSQTHHDRGSRTSTRSYSALDGTAGASRPALVGRSRRLDDAGRSPIMVTCARSGAGSRDLAVRFTSNQAGRGVRPVKVRQRSSGAPRAYLRPARAR